MPLRVARGAALAVALVLCCGPVTCSAAWTNVLHDSACSAHADRGIMSTEPPTETWNIAAPGIDPTAFAILSDSVGNVYLSGNSSVSKYNGPDGEMLWMTPMVEDEAPLIALAPEHGIVLACARDERVLRGLDMPWGNELWTVAVGGAFPGKIVGLLAAPDAGGVALLRGTGYFEVVAARDGALLWVWENLQVAYMDVAVASGRVVAVATYPIEPGGSAQYYSVLMSFDVGTGAVLIERDLPAVSVVDQVALTSDGVLYVLTWNGLVALDASTGAQLWTHLGYFPFQKSFATQNKLAVALSPPGGREASAAALLRRGPSIVTVVLDAEGQPLSEFSVSSATLMLDGAGNVVVFSQSSMMLVVYSPEGNLRWQLHLEKFGEGMILAGLVVDRQLLLALSPAEFDYLYVSALGLPSPSPSPGSRAKSSGDTAAFVVLGVCLFAFFNVVCFGPMCLVLCVASAVFGVFGTGAGASGLGVRVWRRSDGAPSGGEGAHLFGGVHVNSGGAAKKQRVPPPLQDTSSIPVFPSSAFDSASSEEEEEFSDEAHRD